MRLRPTLLLSALIVTFVLSGHGAAPAQTEEPSRRETIAQNSRDALELLKQNSEAAKRLATDAAGILVFPKIVKGGLIFGGQYGEGALYKNDVLSQYYSTAAASFGLQAGLQTFGYAIYFMDPKGLAYLDNSDGWEIGTAPNVVVVDKGAGASLTTTTGRNDIYVFFFDQKGLMAGLTIEGSKITEINPK